jgi:DMSO/TMAO reductase YedYZ heme-binding membrane subunit
MMYRDRLAETLDLEIPETAIIVGAGQTGLEIASPAAAIFAILILTGGAGAANTISPGASTAAAILAIVILATSATGSRAPGRSAGSLRAILAVVIFAPVASAAGPQTRFFLAVNTLRAAAVDVSERIRLAAATIIPGTRTATAVLAFITLAV